MKKRILFLDFLKVISIFSIIAVHETFLLEKYYEHIFFVYIFDFFSFNLSVFYGSLGYMIIEKYTQIENWKRFFYTKFLYIGLPFIAISFLYTLAATYLTPYSSDKPLIIRIFLGFSAPHLYFMTSYIFFIFCTPFFVFLNRKCSKRVFIWLNMGLILLSLLSIYASGHYLSAYVEKQWLIRNPLNWLCYVCTGMLIRIYKKEIILFLEHKKKIVFTFVMLSLTLLEFYFSTHLRFVNIFFDPLWFFQSLCSVIFIFLMYSFFEKSKWIHFFAKAGKETFLIYLSHIFFLVAYHTYIFTDLTLWWHTILLFLFTSSSSLLFSLCTKKIIGRFLPFNS